MKAHLDISHEGTVGTARRTEMTIDTNAVAWIMKMLTDMYPDPPLAVIREYSTNAWDSHRAAGITDPIEVFLPSHLSQIFIVKDHGVGLSVDEIENNFSKYGWSSKRDTDEEVGMLGLGCKSGLTYTSQFTMIACKNGVKATVLITRLENGAGAIQIIATEDTDEVNGVEIQIPVSSVSQFCEKAKTFFSFWPEGDVLIDGKPPVHVGQQESDIWLEDNCILLTKSLTSSYIVMGNVPYVVPSSVASLTPSTVHKAVIWVGIGDIDFTPARELHLTKRTKEILDDARTYIRETLIRRINHEIATAPNHFEALRIASAWKSAMYGLNVRRKILSYKNDTIPDYLHIPGDSYSRKISERPKAHHVFTSQHECPSSRLSETLQVSSEQQIKTLTGYLWVHGHPGVSVSARDKLKLMKYITDNNPLGMLNKPDVILSNQMLGSPWLDGKVKRVEWETIKAISIKDEELPIVQRAPREKYRILDSYGRIATVKDPEGIVLYFNGPRMQSIHARRNLASTFANLRTGQQIETTLFPLNIEKQLKSHLKHFPNSVEAGEWLEGITKLWIASLTPDQLMSFQGVDLDKLGGSVLELELTKIKDPDLVSIYKAMAGRNERTNLWHTLRNGLSTLGRPEPKLPKSDTTLFETLMKRYPLLRLAGDRWRLTHYHQLTSSDLVSYVNMVYDNLQPSFNGRINPHLDFHANYLDAIQLV